ncbi:hypothetical protein DFP72DRAFT_1047334 [Ephemerocybe angulata]|uniref:F-box domain-containing protein n=1 Tax=Ephemerocybe angulata TaxID=980116 RepID=A0A8H6HSB5_9AGAR|nr:hypothetical protein DFP72DRAFT_1047334 [Tulosesus angulatus]
MEDYLDYLDLRPNPPRRRRDLSLLPEMPLDVLLEIFSLLEPKDLLNMARSCKDFRQALVKPSMMHVLWRAKRIESGAPEPPEGFSEAKWVAFLFNTFCYSCATPNVRTDFYIVKRLCVSCKKQGYVQAENFPDNYDTAMLTCIPWTSYAPTSSKEETEDFYAWTDDIEEVATIWATFEERMLAGDAQAITDRNTFERERSAAVQHMREVAPEYRVWADTLEDQKLNNKNHVREARILAVRQCFYELGYDQVDVDGVIDWETPELKTGKGKITDRVWRNLRAKLEPQVVRAAEVRHYELKLDLKLQRMFDLMTAWNIWLETLNLPTSELLKYPKQRDLWYLPAVSALLDAPVDAAIDYLPIVADFSNIARNFIFTKREELRRSVPIANLAEASPDALELATSIFSAPSSTSHLGGGDLSYPKIALGWKMLSVCHLLKNEEEAQEMGFSVEQPVLPIFDEKLSAVAATLVTDVGLNRYTATIADMDALDERFLCLTCIRTKLRYSGKIFVGAYTWKNAVVHSREHHRETIKFERITSERLRQRVDRSEEIDEERSDPDRYQSAFHCNHCFFGPRNGRPALKEEVKEHIRTEHNIEDPSARKGDYILNEVRRQNFEKPSYIHMREEEFDLD